MKLLENIKINGTIEVVSGLHIGAGKEALEIGGLDNAVIKNPKTKEPYIPGSSLKGKLRFLTEWRLGKINGEAVHKCKNTDCAVCRIFGSLDQPEDSIRGTTRLVVRDATYDGDEFDPQTMLEVKYSTAIDRTSGAALNKSLRNIERVVPGVTFKFEIIYRVFDLDDGGAKDKENFKIVIDSLRHLQNDTIGGSGSRGCGQIAFKNITVAGCVHPGNYESIDKLLEKFN
jgi:CRISPR-associated protein Csm3